MKHILIDGTTVSRHIDGLTQYILNVVLRLDMKAARYTLLMREGECPDTYLQQIQARGIAVEMVQIAPIGPLRDWQFARYLRKRNDFDAILVPSNQYPIALRKKAVYVIHDLIYEEFEEQLGKWSKLKKWYLRKVVAAGLKFAQRVICVSEYTQSEVLRCYGTQYAEKMEVIYEGWEHLQNPQLKTEKEKIDKPFEEYILYVGSSRGHKNLARLIEAIGKLKTTNDQLKSTAHWGVVIVGNTKMFSAEQLTAINQLNAGHKVVELTGWVTDEQLAMYFRGASALIFPSLSEGFGIPVLEAYYYKIPLLLSNRASLPEVAGDAAIYFDAYNAEDIARAIREFIAQDDHTELIEKQTKRLALYSWQKTANRISEILESLWDKK